MKTVILDTDFIINSVKNHIDIEESIKSITEYKVEVSYLDKTIDELKNKPLEKLAIKLINSFKQIKTKKDKTVDELILDLTKKDPTILVATQDKELKEKLKKGKIQVISIRQQKYITF